MAVTPDNHTNVCLEQLLPNALAASYVGDGESNSLLYLKLLARLFNIKQPFWQSSSCAACFLFNSI